MHPLTITQRDEQPSPGDLHTCVSGEELQVPADFARALRELNVRTAIDLIWLMQSFPNAVAEMLNWPIGDVYVATEKLRDQLRGTLPAHFLDPPAPTRRTPVFGARHPDLLPKQGQTGQ